MNYQKANALLQGRNLHGKKLDYKTYLNRKGNNVIAITLWETDIMTLYPNGYIKLNTGGWFTNLTKNRLNDYSPANISQKKGKWYLADGSLFYDGMSFRNGEPTKRKYIDKKKDRYIKLINAYCKKLKGLKSLPEPSNGDCWFCSMFDQDINRGQKSTTQDHLLSHLKEKYIHGSLIFNSLKASGYNSPEFIFQMDVRESIIRSVKRFFKVNLGIAR